MAAGLSRSASLARPPHACKGHRSPAPLAPAHRHPPALTHRHRGHRAPSPTPSVAPNAVARLRKQTRVLVAEQTTDAVRDLSQLVWQRPMERGYCTDWGAAGRVWSHVLGPAPGGVGVGDAATGAAGARLCVTQPPHTPPSIAERTLEAAFEEWRFDGVATVLPAQGVAAAWARDNPGTSLASPTNRCGVVIDSGFSFSHVVPFYRGQPVLRGIVRVPVGGKLLTNLLKETVRYARLLARMALGPTDDSCACASPAATAPGTSWTTSPWPTASRSGCARSR